MAEADHSASNLYALRLRLLCAGHECLNALDALERGNWSKLSDSIEAVASESEWGRREFVAAMRAKGIYGKGTEQDG